MNYSVWLSCQALSDNWYLTICHSFLAGCQWSSHHKYLHIARVPSCWQATPQSRLIGCDGRHQKHWLPAICHRSVEWWHCMGVKWLNFPFWLDVLLSHRNVLLAEESRSDSWMSFLQPNVPTGPRRLDVNIIALHAPGVILREWQVHRWVWVHVTKRSSPRLWGQEQQAGYVTPRKPASLFWMVSHAEVCRLPPASILRLKHLKYSKSAKWQIFRSLSDCEVCVNLCFFSDGLEVVNSLPVLIRCPTPRLVLVCVCVCVREIQRQKVWVSDWTYLHPLSWDTPVMFFLWCYWTFVAPSRVKLWFLRPIYTPTGTSVCVCVFASSHEWAHSLCF